MAMEKMMVNYDQSPGQWAWGMAEIGISWRPKGSQKPTCDKGSKGIAGFIYLFIIHSE
jgi:hypothetical protein